MSGVKTADQVCCIRFGPSLHDERCSKSPARRYRAACVHEHVVETWACDECVGLSRRICGPCEQRDGHQCPVSVQVVA